MQNTIINGNNTFSNGCLGSHNDEERSEMRYVMRIAKSSESSKLWTHLALPSGSMPVGVFVHPHTIIRLKNVYLLHGFWSWSLLNSPILQDVCIIVIYNYNTKNCDIASSVITKRNDTTSVKIPKQFLHSTYLSWNKTVVLMWLLQIRSDLQSDKNTRWI